MSNRTAMVGQKRLPASHRIVSSEGNLAITPLSRSSRVRGRESRRNIGDGGGHQFQMLVERDGQFRPPRNTIYALRAEIGFFMNNSFWDELKQFVARNADIGIKKSLTRSTLVERDLDITGDDAIDFMNKFFNNFCVQTGDFSFERYFSGEGFNLIDIVLMLISKKARMKYHKVPLTLGMLHQAIVDGRWDCGRLESISPDASQA
ncbi:DUF1493 family protein [Burkholderia cepacia]|uniref:DUF1493 family protein n=1 Tax=Burkholderia cepacia TaxID=292 RepID=UPI002AB635D9|nr:DUF1493 family protein [Burkholderia cepacia]